MPHLADLLVGPVLHEAARRNLLAGSAFEEPRDGFPNALRRIGDLGIDIVFKTLRPPFTV
jgi:hypothetical protein